MVVTNHYVTPSMRICSMNPMTALISAFHQDDIQWRYDELNKEILESYGQIDLVKAKDLINFLAPQGKYPEYYAKSEKSSDGKTCVVEGSIALCNLTDKVIHNLCGYYEDEWTTITLPNYVD